MSPSPGCTLDASSAHNHLPHNLHHLSTHLLGTQPKCDIPLYRNNWDVLTFLRIELLWRRKLQTMHRNNHEMSLLKALGCVVLGCPP